MTILEAITEANDTSKIRTLAFANIQEFQSFQDSFNFVDYPANVIVPPSLSGSRTDNRNKAVVALQGWVIQRIPEDTDNYRSIKIEETYMHPMREKAIKFMNALLETDIIDPEVTNVSWTVRPEYMWLSNHLFGVSYTINLPINMTVCKY